MSQILYGTYQYLNLLKKIAAYMKSKFSSTSLYFCLLNLATLACGPLWSAGPAVGMESWHGRGKIKNSLESTSTSASAAHHL